MCETESMRSQSHRESLADKREYRSADRRGDSVRLIGARRPVAPPVTPASAKTLIFK